MRSSREFSGGQRLGRRAFLDALATLGPAAAAFGRQDEPSGPEAQVALVRGSDRAAAIRSAWEMLPRIDLAGKDIYLKGNFNSAHPYPASTAPEALRAVMGILRGTGCGAATLIERSGMGKTGEVWRALGIPKLAGELGLKLLALDELPPEAWVSRSPAGSHWKRGVEVPVLLGRETVSIQVCNLKTHRFGGHFSASLKNALGVLAKRSSGGDGYNYMTELHDSPDQRLMIAEASQVYAPAISILDAMRIFITEGPERGEVASPGVIAASSDRVALDAVGVALLRLYDARLPEARSNIFELEQIKRAAELGLGVKSPERITLLTLDSDSRELGTRLKALMADVQEPAR